MGIGKINRVKVDLCSYPPYLFLAPRKFGKTTWWSNLVPAAWGDATKGLLIAFEEGYHALDGVNVESVKEWNADYDEETDMRGFVQIVDDLVENNREYNIKGVCIDTLDKMVDVATKEVLRQHKKERGTVCKTLNEAFAGYGRGKERLRNICNEQIDRLRDAGIAVFFLCHTKAKERTDMLSGEKFEQITNNLNDDIYTNFADDAQMVMVGAFDREIVGGKIINEERSIYLRESATVDAGGRFESLPEKISLDVTEFLRVFEDAVKASAKTGIDITRQKKEEETRREKMAEIAKEKDQQRTKDDEEDTRKAYLKIIVDNFNSADKTVQEEAKGILKTAGFKKFTDGDIPTEVLKNIADLF